MFWEEDTDDKELFEKLNFYKTSSEYLAFWYTNTNLYLPLDILLMPMVYPEGICTLVFLQWIMYLFRDDALPNEHPSLLK